MKKNQNQEENILNNSPQLEKKAFSSSQKSNSSSSFIQINDEENINICQEILNYFKNHQQQQNQNHPDEQQSIIFFESQHHKKQTGNHSHFLSASKKENQQNNEQTHNVENPELQKIISKKIKKINTLDELISETVSEKNSEISQKQKKTKYSKKNPKNKTPNFQNQNKNFANSNNNNNNFQNTPSNSDLSLEIQDSEEKSDIDSETMHFQNQKFLEIFEKNLEDLEKDPELKKIIQNNGSHLQNLQNQTSNYNNNKNNQNNQQQQQIEFVNCPENNCQCCNFEELDIDLNNNNSDNEQEKQESQEKNQLKTEQNLEKKINKLNSKKLAEISPQKLVFFNFDQIWFHEIYENYKDDVTVDSAIDPIKYDEQWSEIVQSYANNENLILLKYSLDDQMISDLKNYKNPIILAIQGSISEQIIPIVHKFKNLLGIIIYGTKRMQERLQQNGFLTKYKKIMSFVENKEQCYYEIKDYFVNFYKKRICKYKEIDNLLGKHLPISSYLLKAPLKLMQAHYLLNSKYQFIKGKNEFFILNNFSEIKNLTKENLVEILNDIKSHIQQNKTIFDLRVLKQAYIEKISQSFIDCTSHLDEQDIAQAFLRIYLNCKPYFRLINQIMESLDEQLIQKAKIFITSLRLSIQSFVDIEDFWSQEQKKQQLNLLENSEGFIDARALATNIQDCQKVLNPTISLYVGDRFYKHKYLKEKFEVGDQIVFPNFIRAVKNEQIGQQLATNQCGQKMTLFQIEFKKSQFQKNNNNFGARLKAIFNSENQRPKSIKQFGKFDYQKFLKEYIINCFQVFKIEEINENYDGGFLLIRMSVV
ncbi:hypothetical protein PPERSA_00600 [Pseudocohnilembus persalinus]|uniref:Uncharacterized protein n=1 Tax=Pseudocohnilembus persalinus TaxID=266149 RepID=A0A0V0QSI3_PSEPJ|nr:hypothetical protein PPERSA_00600 [Pseudocohnilembus persalinus]|eukprot:KRX05299.1 hypothetical protein PPERSA_00600 [Pseudocohnilembus persalinus]